jgi:hypothetical protein
VPPSHSYHQRPSLLTWLCVPHAFPWLVELLERPTIRTRLEAWRKEADPDASEDLRVGLRGGRFAHMQLCRQRCLAGQPRTVGRLCVHACVDALRPTALHVLFSWGLKHPLLVCVQRSPCPPPPPPPQEDPGPLSPGFRRLSGSGRRYRVETTFSCRFCGRETDKPPGMGRLTLPVPCSWLSPPLPPPPTTL